MISPRTSLLDRHGRHNHIEEKDTIRLYIEIQDAQCCIMLPCVILLMHAGG